VTGLLLVSCLAYSFNYEDGSDTLLRNVRGCLLNWTALCAICSACSLLLVGFLLGLFFEPADGGDMFLRIVGIFSEYTALNIGERIVPTHCCESLRSYDCTKVLDCLANYANIIHYISHYEVNLT
jgi:hypothetical protein